MKDQENTQVAIVTGAAGGIGRATARKLAADGFRVVASDLTDEHTRALADELGGLAHAADVTNEDAIASLVNTAVETYGRLDVMVNNAGQPGAAGSITNVRAEDWSRSIAVLLDSVFYGMKHAAKAMIEAGQGGAILSTTSIAGQRAVGGHPYNAAKHALVGLTRSAAADLAPHGIRVNGVAPGYVLTPMTSGIFGSEQETREKLAERSALPGLLEPDDIANAFAFLAGNGARNITGQQITVDGGFLECLNRSEILDADPAYLGTVR